MILVSNKDLYDLPPEAVIAELSAHGEPQRRTWTISLKWSFRNGAVTGESVFNNQWLTGVTQQLNITEKDGFSIKVGALKGPERTKPKIHLLVPPELLRTVTSTLKRYGVAYEELPPDL